MRVSITLWYHRSMTIASLERAIKSKRPAVIKEKGTPRFVILDWKTYRKWEEMREDIEDHIRFEISERESHGKPRYSLDEVKRKFHLP